MSTSNMALPNNAEGELEEWEPKPCEYCGSSQVKLRRVVLSNGLSQYRWYCDSCSQNARKYSQNIPYWVVDYWHTTGRLRIMPTDVPVVAIVIGNEVFRTKDEAKKRIQEMLRSYRDGEMVNDDDFAFLLDLLEMHPNADSKIGCGVASFYADRNPVYPSSRGFYVVRVDGSETDFSFMKCLYPSTQRKKVMRAMRAVIEPYTMRFKQSFFDSVGGVATCPVSGEIIRFIGSHVDHIPPDTFEAIVERFLDAQSLSFDDVLVTGTADMSFRIGLVDRDLERKWIEFHNRVARLRVVSRTANLLIIKREARAA